MGQLWPHSLVHSFGCGACRGLHGRNNGERPLSAERASSYGLVRRVIKVIQGKKTAATPGRLPSDGHPRRPAEGTLHVLKVTLTSLEQ